VTRTRLAVLSGDDIGRIREATLELLEDTGVLVREPRARTLLTDAGARAVERSDRLLLPSSLVKEAVGKAPKAWTWHARESRYDLRIGEGGRTKLGPGSSCTNYVDFPSGRARMPTSDDALRLLRLLDALPLVDICYTPVADAHDGDLPPRCAEAATFVRDLENTSKPVVGPSFDGTMAKDALDIAAILVGGREELRKRPTVAGYCDPVGPLIHDRNMTEMLIEYAAMGQPVFIVAADLAGASAPATLAGLLVQQNAELLSGLLIAHLVNRDAPVILGTVSGALDMRTGSAVFGGPELGLTSIATVQLCHSYGLPCAAGGQSDAKVHDAQAALEKATTLLASVLAGADLVDLFYGSYEGFNATSVEQVVIDHDIAAYAFRYAEGIEVNEETLALDVMREVGPGNSFLQGRKALEHTMKWFRGEHALPMILDRRSRRAWSLAGERTLLQEAHERAESILREHRPTPMAREVQSEIEIALKRIFRETTRAA